VSTKPHEGEPAEREPLIIQVPHEGAVHLQLIAAPPESIASGRAVLESMDTDADGNLVAIDIGEVVLSVPSPEALERESDQVRTVIGGAGTGTEPLVLIVEAAEELRDEEIAPVVEALSHTPRPVILRIVRNA
jgi:hypothetical protein